MPGTRNQDFTESEALLQASEESFYQCTHPDKGSLSLGIRIETYDGITDISDHIGYYRDPEMAESRLALLKCKLKQYVNRLQRMGKHASLEITYSSYCYQRYSDGMPQPETETAFLHKVTCMVA